jgi:hypothetical protein
MIELYAHTLATMSPWWLVAIGCSLYIIDWMYTNTDLLMIVGIAVLLQVFPNLLGFPEITQAWLTPLFLLIAFFMQGWISQKLKSKALLPFETHQTYVGMHGTISSVQFKNESTEYFSNFDNLMNLKDSKPKETTFIKKVVLDNGESYPLKETCRHLSEEVKVIVVGFDGIEMNVQENKNVK